MLWATQSWRRAPDETTIDDSPWLSRQSVRCGHDRPSYQSCGELSANDVYALTAWILAENKIVKPTAVLTEQTLPAVQMPNQKGFEDAAAAK